MDSLIEQIREEVVQDLLKVKAFKSGWEKRSTFLRSKLPAKGAIKSRSILDLGQHLSATFKLSGTNDRTQGSLSSGGAVWESLVVWYMNICLTGTRAVCTKGGALTPQPVKDALSILHENTILRSEPDVLIISSEFLQKAPRVKKRSDILPVANKITEDAFSSFGIINIQCKTNWNDNAQIPMLWNMLYNQARKGAVIPNGFSIGHRGFSLMNLGHFGYAFATVPTQSKAPDGYKANTLEVQRVKSMTAGNYWGHPTKNSVCSSLSEFFSFFTRNRTVFPNVSEIGVQAAKTMNSDSETQFDASRLLFPT